MELKTKLPVPDRETRKVIEDNFKQIESTLSRVESKTEKLQKALGLTDDELNTYDQFKEVK